MMLMLDQAWVLAVGPLVCALAIVLLGRVSGAVAPVLALVGTLLTTAAGIAGTLALGAGHGAAESATATTPLASGSWPWFAVASNTLQLGWSVDALTLIMLTVVGVVASCVVVFSIGYLHGDPGWNRYFATIALFTGAMNLLVIADTLTTLFIGWELVGASSYLLIGFWYEKPSASAAAVKAFLTTRVGDVGLLLGIAVLWTETGSDAYRDVFAALPAVSPTMLSAAAVCLAIGAIGKSAQFPLHGWLPDAMEGPTPVSALIHAATMVAAGVFLVARLWPLFEVAQQARTLLLAVGAISAVGAALVATTQRDIKKVLAYSTISQLGFMFAALGVGAWGAAFFHLVTHAAFKALLFLGSGSVIHGSGTQDLHEMGGLRSKMPFTFGTWLVGALALAGVFPFAGFFSKDAVLEALWSANPAVAVLLFAASALTAFYITRATRLAFFGVPAVERAVHESGWSMLGPLAVLAVLATGLGFASGFVSSLLGHHHEPLALGISAAALVLAAVGGLLGWRLSNGPTGDVATAKRLGVVHSVLSRAYGWDEAVDRFVVRPAVGASRLLWAVGDRLVADGLVEGSARGAQWVGARISRLQDGDAQSYATAIAVGFVLVVIAAVWIGA